MTSENKKRRIIVFFDLKQAPTIGLKSPANIFGVSFFTFFSEASSQTPLFLASSGCRFFAFFTSFFGLVTDATISHLQRVSFFRVSFLHFSIVFFAPFLKVVLTERTIS
jgi:hypothetical protein